MSELKSRFDLALERANSLPPQSTTNQLELYGLFKQATKGDVTGARPGMLDPRGRAKWDAWSKRKGLSLDAAMEAYIALVDKLDE
jgi:acyl-CoA-binding protein